MRGVVCATCAAGAAAAYGWWIRPRLVRWGATDEEVEGPFPGADVVPLGTRAPTMAVTIDARPDQVWPWLVQMGWGRGGWYSWDLLDNGGRPSACCVHREWQDLEVGDQLRFSMFGRVVDAYRVQVLEPDRFLGLYGCTDLRGRWLDPEQQRPSSYMEALWGFRLVDLPHGRTRLVIGGYQVFRPRWVERFLVPWAFILMVWPMQARMMAVLRRNVERDNALPDKTLPATACAAPRWRRSRPSHAAEPESPAGVVVRRRR